LYRYAQPPPAPCLGPDTGVSDVEWGIISAFIVENLILAAVGGAPVQVEYSVSIA
jgi:hypothetical protein